MKKNVTPIIVGLIALFSLAINPANAQWAPIGNYPVYNNNGSFSNSIQCLTKDSSGNLYAAGAFSNGNGKYYVAKWNGNTWSEVGGANTSTFNSTISTLSIDASGNLYAAGLFTNGSDRWSGNQFVAKWNGSVWSEVGGTNTSAFNNSINSLSTDASGNLYAAGAFTNGSSKNYVAKWNGNAWSEVGGTNTYS